MKVLVVAGAFYPAKRYGGPVVSIDNMCTLLKDQCDFYLIARDHDFGEEKRLEGITSGWNERNNCKVLYLSEDKFTYEIFQKVYLDVSPDFVYVNSLFDAKLTLSFLKICKEKKCNVLLAPRGQLCDGAFKRKYKKIPFIWYLKMKGLIKDVYFQSTSDDETNAIKKYLKAKNNNIFYLPNIPSIPSRNIERLEKKEGEGDFVFLSRIHPKKNLVSALSFFNSVKGSVRFDIYGPIEDSDYWSECQKVIEKLPKNITVNYCGLTSHDEVHNVFSRYNGFLFPTFSENYGHVIAESLIAGTPVIIRDQTPWNDVSIFNCGWAIPLSDKKSFCEKIQAIVDLNDSGFQKMSLSAKEYAYKKADLLQLTRQYRDAFEKTLAYSKEN